MRVLILLFLVQLMFLQSCDQQPSDQLKLDTIEHVLVIGVDGMSPDGIQQAHTPHLDRLRTEGAYTYQARAVLPTSSSPNWASMIMGAGPEQHGITSNAWARDDFTLPTNAGDEKGFFPTIFTLLHDQRPEAEVGAIYHWKDFGRLFDSTHVTYNQAPASEEETAAVAAQYIKEKKPTFCFVHLDHVDGAGHSKGHGSPTYYEAVSKADSLIGELLMAVEEAGMEESTLIIVTADHGGLGFGHGGESPEEMLIPFILWGKSIKKAYSIASTVNTYDNAVTAAFALQLEIPLAWIGRPVKEAFQGSPVPKIKYPVKKLVRMPIIHPKKIGFEQAGGLFVDSLPTLNISNPNEEGQIRYTLDGTSPDKASAIFTSPFPLQQTAIVKTAIFEGDKKLSKDVTGYFRVHQPTPAHGIRYKSYIVEGMEKLPDFVSLKPASQGNTYEYSLDHLDLPQLEQIAVTMEGYIEIDVAGPYQFYIASDDGSQLWVNDQLVADNDGNHGVIERSGTIELPKGRHLLNVKWYNSGGGMGLFTYYKGPNTPKQLIPAEKLYLRNDK